MELATLRSIHESTIHEYIVDGVETFSRTRSYCSEEIITIQKTSDNNYLYYKYRFDLDDGWILSNRKSFIKDNKTNLFDLINFLVKN